MPCRPRGLGGLDEDEREDALEDLLGHIVEGREASAGS